MENYIKELEKKDKSLIHNSRVHVVMIALVLLIATISVAFFQSGVAKTIHMESERTVVDLLSDHAQQVSNLLDNQIQNIWRHMRVIDNSLGIIKEMSFEEAQSFLTEIFPSAFRAELATADGEFVDNRGKRGIIPPDEDMLRLFSKGEHICVLRQDGLQDSIVFGMAVSPVNIEGKTYEYALISFSLDTIMDIISLESYAGEGKIRILNNTGLVISATDNIETDKTSYYFFRLYKNAKFLFNEEYDNWEGFRKSVLEGDNYAVHVVLENGENKVISYAKPQYMDWYVTIVMDYVEVLGGLESSVDAISRSSIFFTIAVVALALLVVAFIASDSYKTRQEKKTLQLLNDSLDRSRRVTEEALATAEQANRAKSTFLSNMSHDIRTPMNAIMGFVTLLDKDAENPERVREYAKKITNSSRHLMGLINDVFDMAKIESGKITMNPEKTDLWEMIEDVNTMISAPVKDKGHQFDISIQNVIHETIYVDRLRIHQILLNLLTNAVKYTPDKGHILLEVSELSQVDSETAKYRFSVTDNGYGMAPEYLSSVFDLFSREQNSVVNKIQGTGLGLAITKNLVDIMGGTITVTSQKGEGSIFTVELNLKFAKEEKSPEPERESKAAPTCEKGLKGAHILVAEDNQINAEILTELLKIEGASCDVYENGKLAYQAFAASGEDEYQLVLMDIQMLEMNGYEATRRIRACLHPRAKTIPIIAMTADAFPEDIQKSKEAGMDAHLAKPINMNQLKKLIGELL